jgi:hypothetical protein
MTDRAGIDVRVGLPLTGGRLVAAARDRKQPVLFSANAFARTFPRGHERAGEFRAFARPDLHQLQGMDAALDSAGFVAATRYGDYRWTVAQYVDLAAAFPWRWWASMDYCCEPEVASDRPLRLLRIAATAGMLAQCAREAEYRGIAPPMPILQGWTVAEYLQCVEWLPLWEWPELVGVGSMCRRHVHGSNGILEIVEGLDGVLPSHVRLHLFGIKSEALRALVHHPRVAAVDSMAWDMKARAQRRTGRDMHFRIACMDQWLEKQGEHLDSGSRGAGIQRSLLDPAETGPITDVEALVIEAVAMQWAQMLVGNEWSYRSAVHHCRRDAAAAIAIFRHHRGGARVILELEDLFEGVGERFEQMLGG